MGASLRGPLVLPNNNDPSVFGKVAGPCLGSLAGARYVSAIDVDAWKSLRTIVPNNGMSCVASLILLWLYTDMSTSVGVRR
mgnify:CR=1 FL=1